MQVLRAPPAKPAQKYEIGWRSQPAEDKSVPARFARTFHEQLTPLYASAPERLCYVEYPAVGHDLSLEIWEESSQKMAAWFQRFL